MTFTLNVTPKSCERCGYNAQFNWEGVNVCGSGCYELLMIQRAKHGPEWVAFSIQKLLGDSVLEVQETIGNIVKAGEFVKIWSTARYYPASESWVIELNKYQRDNLLWLFNAIGYPNAKTVEPFHLANTGDWAGEIPNMLVKPGKDCVIDENDHPNRTIADLKDAVTGWIKNK